MRNQKNRGERTVRTVQDTLSLCIKLINCTRIMTINKSFFLKRYMFSCFPVMIMSYSGHDLDMIKVLGNVEMYVSSKSIQILHRFQ
jgi:hypothetical protein